MPPEPFETEPELTGEALIEALPEPVLLVGSDRRIEAANRAARELFGEVQPGALARAALRQPEEVELLDAGFRALATPEAPQGPFHATRLETGPEGERLWQIEALPVAGRLVISLRDGSHLEAAETQRRDFVSNVSHEMRSPLTALIGFIETLRGPAREDAKARDLFLEIMEREAQRMSRLVADLLSLAEVEGEERVRPRGKVGLKGLLNEVAAAFRPRITAAGLVLEVILPEGLETEVEIPGARDQLQQVLHNLVENALRYGATGGRISLELRLSEAASGPMVELEVRDYGEGIDPVHLPRLTERFYRVDDHRSRELGGTGLGLAIVKHIVNRHRGRLVIQSRKGEGARFTMMLPRG